MTTRVARACIALGAALASACSGDTPAGPTPPPAPDPLILTCPAGVSQVSPTAQPIAIRYGTATATGGTPPVQVTCSPGSDTLFPVGRTTVGCTGADTRAVTASCTFGVTVTGPPTVSLTQYIAFGDSITAGEITVEGEGHIRTLQLVPALSYPTDLKTSLSARYTAQPISMTNQGVKGENTFDGLARLPPLLSATQVLLLVEGANDINGASNAQVQASLGNIRSMVRLAKGRNVRVFLGNLPPERPFDCDPCRTGGAAQVDNFNSGIRSIATSENVPFVDVFTALNADTSTLIGPDGLHPTATGYAKMAQVFFDSVKATLEVTATPTITPSSKTVTTYVAPWRPR